MSDIEISQIHVDPLHPDYFGTVAFIRGEDREGGQYIGIIDWKEAAPIVEAGIGWRYGQPVAKELGITYKEEVDFSSSMQGT